MIIAICFKEALFKVKYEEILVMTSDSVILMVTCDFPV